MNILVIEDQNVDRLLLAARLRLMDENLRMVEVDSLADATEVLSLQSFDLIFLDLLLTDTPGFELNQAYQFIEEHKKTPLIVVTAHEDDEVVYNCFRSGAFEFISKPVQRNILKRMWVYANERKRRKSEIGERRVEVGDGSSATTYGEDRADRCGWKWTLSRI